MKVLNFIGTVFLVLIFILVLLTAMMKICLYINISNLLSFNLVFSLKLNFMLWFFFVVLIISCLVFLYSFYYMETSSSLVLFYLMKIIFVLSMMILVLSNSAFVLFLGWDGLGVSSYFLVIFYLNWKSNNSGYTTILANRLGDSIFMVVLCMFLLSSSFMLETFFSKSSFFILMILILVVCFTKSAQYPFSSWLPIAMSAPTPISALVHSSTLVTAGIVLLIQFIFFLKNDFFMIFTLWFVVLTMIHSGVLSLVELDLKKIVALSTLNQLSLMMVTLAMGFKLITFFHLNTHALFKSLLFLNVGIFIHLMFSLQDNRAYSLMTKSMKMSLLSFFLSSMSLMGISFFSGFYSKDLFIENMSYSFFSLGLVFLIYMMMSFTFIYTFRLIVSVKMKFLSMSINVVSSAMSIYPSLLILSLMSIFFGKTFFENFFSWKFFSMNKSLMKSVLVLMLIIILITISFFLWSNYMNKVYFSSMFLLNLITVSISWIYFFFLNCLKNILEKSWMEMISSKKESNYLNMVDTQSMFFQKKLMLILSLMSIFLLVIIL